MRIAMVVRSFSENGGLELYAHQLVKGLLERGHDLTVVCEQNDSPLHHSRLKIRKFYPAPENTNKATRLKHYFDASTYGVAQEGAGAFDIVHSQHLPTQSANVVTFHNHTAARLVQVGYDWEQMLTRAKMAFVPAYKLRDQYDRELCQSASSLIFPSAVCRDDFVQTYNIPSLNPRCNISVAYPGASLGGVAAAEVSPANTDRYHPFTFLFVGKGFRKKGLDVLLKACAELKKQGRNFRLLIAGLNRKPVDVARLAIMGLKDNVQYLGFCKQMEEVYMRAAAVVLPSRIEPFGMAPLQGAMYGCVPVVSRVCGAAEVIESGVNGLVLENHLDATELAGLLSRLMDGREQATAMATAASGTAAELTWARTVDSTVKAYEAALAILKS